ncbi:ABC transporter ATP-binding protein [Lentilactobacillus farraginis]|uniref:ABC transporter, ATP-binding protein n=1 Tax=Lentilactobacillus farraginis DSM 18382 = JCM 14108 TaxID=1423743 RepID=X0PME1_9LACO|nr:ABC transporter ATP-binding protein [Lentilactobacillus farraginis]KRM03758.1 multidrug ABC superfamily ATP binding cassette transporter, ABC protein [Lentilactobacillus farraginis DSM 18382 = JCM 14108]GAF37986.1 ABC transporter, ATP-binding protein [Lentilactobacillus farraginis DSM 18382 = JCM 14108]
MTAIIQLNNLSFAYDKKSVLKNLNLTVQSGEILGLVGPNGAGKTTLLHLIQGILHSSHHAITVFGGQPGSLLAKAKISTMPQKDLQLNNIKVSEFVNLFASQADHPQNPAAVIQALGLTEIKNRLINQLSGGQRRKVSFAGAVVSNPQLLFLDEPTVGMDAGARQNFWDYIETLRQQNVTIIITSHYLEEIQKVADRIAILQTGQFSYVGSWQALQSHHTNGQLHFTTSLALSVFTHLSAVTAAHQTTAGITLLSNDTDLTLQALLPFIDQLHDITITRESLESIFLEMTNKGGLSK